MHTLFLLLALLVAATTRMVGAFFAPYLLAAVGGGSGLVFLICPLSMGAMVWGMSRMNSGSNQPQLGVAPSLPASSSRVVAAPAPSASDAAADLPADSSGVVATRVPSASDAAALRAELHEVTQRQLAIAAQIGRLEQQSTPVGPSGEGARAPQTAASH